MHSYLRSASIVPVKVFLAEKGDPKRWGADSRVRAVISACFEHKHSSLWIFRQASCDDQTRQSTSYNDKVGLRVHFG